MSLRRQRGDVGERRWRRRRWCSPRRRAARRCGATIRCGRGRRRGRRRRRRVRPGRVWSSVVGLGDDDVADLDGGLHRAGLDDVGPPPEQRRGDRDDRRGRGGTRGTCGREQHADETGPLARRAPTRARAWPRSGWRSASRTDCGGHRDHVRATGAVPDQLLCISHCMSMPVLAPCMASIWAWRHAGGVERPRHAVGLGRHARVDGPAAEAGLERVDLRDARQRRRS